MFTITEILARRSRLIPALAATLTAVAIIPGTAAAHTAHFGSSLDHTPGNAGSSCADDGAAPQTGVDGQNPLAATQLCTHVGSYYPGFSGHANSPVTGTITKLKIIPEGPMTFTAQVVTVRGLSSDEHSGQAKATASSRQITLAGPTQDQASNSDYPIDTVNVHLKVHKGQEIAITTASNTAEDCSDGTPGQLLFYPGLKIGQPFASSASVDGCIMLVQAVVQY